MKRFRPSQVFTDGQITDETTFHNRRRIIKSLGFVGAGALLSQSAHGFGWFDDEPEFKPEPLSFTPSSKYSTSETKTPYEKVTSYNNFYEFGTGKDDPAKRAKSFKPAPWTLRIDGMVNKPITLDYDAIMKQMAFEERVYRMRCVEAWSMVIPWIGFELNKLISLASPLSDAKYVAFETLHDPKRMPGQRNPFIGGGIDYPYVEGLRLDEAMHPLTLMATGVYGKTLPPQNGAPIRLVVPWKYGFKSIKSIVRITLTDKQPPTTWNQLAANEYGFYANVNPNVAHPRWSQASERRITDGGVFNQQRIATRMFNGYDEVASLYSSMDLARYY